MAKETEQEYRKAWPFVTVDQVSGIVAQRLAGWRAARPAARPYLGFDGPEDLRHRVESLRAAADAETVRRRERLSQVVDELIHVRWLRTYDNRGDFSWEAKQLGFPTPIYKYPDELVNDRLLHQDAQQELWQRDIGNALPALAFGAHLFPERYDLCVERMRSLVLASIEFPTWGASEPYANMDLCTDHLARGISIAYDWHPTIWSSEEKARIFAVLSERLGILLRGAYGDAFWARGWTENHCSNAFVAMGIAGAAFLDEIADAATWLGAATAGVQYAIELRNADGSSDEGIPYWSYGMSFLLQYIELTHRMTGADSLYDLPHMKSGGRYRLHCSLPDLSGAVTFGDAFRRDFYGPSHILYALARRYQDETLQWFGDAIPYPICGGADNDAWALIWRDSALAAERPATLPLDYHLADWDVALSRSGWSSSDCVLAVKSGFTNRNHSHLDAGALLFGWGGQWLIEAPGYGIVGPGFWDPSGPRWKYYSNATESHSTLVIGGQNQRFDVCARGTINRFDSTSDRCYICVDLSDAYQGGHHIRRRILHRRALGAGDVAGYMLVLDEIEAATESEPLSVEWLLQPGRTVRIEPEPRASNASGAKKSSGEVVLAGDCGRLRVRSLVGESGFAPHAPNSEHIDIPENAVRTLALRAEGKSVVFAVLMTAEREGAGAGAEIEARFESASGAERRIVVSGSGFTDVLTSSGPVAGVGRQ